MRAILPLAILVAPGAAYAQSTDPMLPGSVAQWSDERIAPAAGLTAFAEQFSPAALLAEPADDALALPALPARTLPAVAFADTAALVSLSAFVDAGTLVDINLVVAAVADATTTEATGAEPSLGMAAQPSVVALAPAIVETAATAAPAVAEIALTDAADTENAGAAPIALADQAEVLFGTVPVSEGELAETKGKAGIDYLAAIANSTSNVNNNKVGDNSTTGTVNVTGQAFQNVSGFAMVNFNTGTQSSINANMVVNVQINYAAPSAP